MHVTAGDHWVAASCSALYEGLPPSYGGPNPSKRPDTASARRHHVPEDPARMRRRNRSRSCRRQAEERTDRSRVPANRVWVHYMEALGPYDQTDRAVADSLKKIYHLRASGRAASAGLRAQDSVANFARRAFRRPVSPTELQPYLKLAASTRKQGASFDEASGDGDWRRFWFRRISCSASRIRPKAGQRRTFARSSQYRVGLAAFVFPLVEHAGRGAAARGRRKARCASRRCCEAQVRRMLKDPKAHALVDNFAGQWLELRRLESVAPGSGEIPASLTIICGCRCARKRSSSSRTSCARTGSILDLIDAKYTFLNERLARVLRHSGCERRGFPAGRSAGHASRRHSDAGERADGLFLRNPHFAGSARKMGAGESSERAVPAASAERPAARRSEDRHVGLACGSDGGASRESGVRFVSFEDGPVWASALKTSTRSAQWRDKDGKFPDRFIGRCCRMAEHLRVRTS